MAKEKEFYTLRILNDRGDVHYTLHLTEEERARLKERLDKHLEDGDLGDYFFHPIFPATALKFAGITENLDNLLGSYERKAPDEFRVPERLPEKEETLIRDLLTAAFEGGSNYWYRIESAQYPPGSKKADFKEGGRMQPAGEYYHWSALVPTYPGGSLVIREVGEGEGESFVLDLPALKRGLILMREKYPRHYANILSENWDAETGDVFLQLSLFGDIVFG